MKTLYKTSAAALSLVMLLAACSHEEPSAQAHSASQTVQAKVLTVQPVRAEQSFPVTGQVEAVESVQLASRMMGYIRELHVVQGQAVKKDQVLFVIDPLDTQGAIDLAKQNLLQAEAALRDAQADYERFKNLYKDEAVNKQQLEKMRLNYEVSLSRVAQAKAGLNVARGQLDYTRVSAPMDGIITAKLANEGDMAKPGYPVLMMEDPSRMRVKVAVPEAIFQDLKPGDTAQIEVDGQSVQGTVAHITPTADPQARTYPVTLDVRAPGLRSGAFAKVFFPQGEQQVLRIPQAAVLDRAGVRGVFVLDSENLAHYRMLRTGQVHADGSIEVLAGLVAGERIAVPASGTLIRNGDKVVD